jgi:hypothetical protein
LKWRKLLILHDGKNDRNVRNGVPCAENVQKVLVEEPEIFKERLVFDYSSISKADRRNSDMISANCEPSDDCQSAATEAGRHARRISQL